MVFLFHATSGVCTGIIMVIAQVYVAEVSVPRIRGAISSAPLLAFQVLFVVLGSNNDKKR